jgi:DUF1365 family protein
MHSCLYTGRVAHQRRSPVKHAFRYRIGAAYIDLDEADELLRTSQLASAAKIAPLSFRAQDHARGLAEIRSPTELAASIRTLVAAGGVERPIGAVRVLTQFRQWGVYFSPLNLYFCFEAGRERVAAVVAEVSNTPWKERRRYVLQVNDGGSELRFWHDKDFHVSPFMGMDVNYQWRLTKPAERLRVHLRCRQGREAPFDATLALVRRPWTERALAAYVCRFPVSSVQILAAIYWQALQLWWKKCPYYEHPGAATGA